MEKTILAVVIIGVTIFFVTVWVSVDFCLYRERKREAREKKMYKFYHYGRPERRSGYPHACKGTVNMDVPVTKTVAVKVKSETIRERWRRLFDLFRKQKNTNSRIEQEPCMTLNKATHSVVTSFSVSDCTSENQNSIELDAFSEIHASSNTTSNCIDSKIQIDPTRKRNSITPCDILPPNTMALSPSEMESVFYVKDSALLDSSAIDQCNISTESSDHN